MASYRGHLTFSTALGTAFGGLSWWQLGVDWPIAACGGLFCAIGGLLPDLDSHSGVPVREMFNLAATVVPLVLLRRLIASGLSMEEMFLIYFGLYFFIRFVAGKIFRRLCVHRGMFHSVPAMLIAGQLTYLAYHHPNPAVRIFMALGTMLGFLSHLVLDEMCSVDFNGVVPKLNQFAGTAVKFYSKSIVATVFTYMQLFGLGYLVYLDFTNRWPAAPMLAGSGGDGPHAVGRQGVTVRERPEKPDQFRPRWFKPAESASPKAPNPPPLAIPGPG